MNIFFQLTGWIGTILIILGYFLVSSNRMKGTSTVYQLMNLFGALLLGIDMAMHGTLSGLTLQIIWAVIAIFSLIKHRMK